jgi:hypothetical protein
MLQVPPFLKSTRILVNLDCHDKCVARSLTRNVHQCMQHAVGLNPPGPAFALGSLPLLSYRHHACSYLKVNTDKIWRFCHL